MPKSSPTTRLWNTVQSAWKRASGAMMLRREIRRRGAHDRIRSRNFAAAPTHRPRRVGIVRITQETAVASGIRRIEAITGSAALHA